MELIVKSIAIVDDSKFIHVVLGSILSELGEFEYFNAFDGSEALEIVHEHSPDVLFLDLNMPGMDGIEIISDIVKAKNIPAIILMSGEEQRVIRSVRDVAVSHGIVVLGILPKPLKKELIETLLSKYSGRQALKTDVVAPLTREDVQNNISSDVLVAMYQPIIDLKDQQLHGVEALVRWNDPTHGLLPPSSFLHLLDDEDMWKKFNEIFFDKAFSDLSDWLSEGLDITLSLNLDLLSLQSKSFVGELLTMMSVHNIKPENVIIEVTETSVLSDIRMPLITLTRLRMKGFGISIDDFGTGASSLERIRDMPCNELKIDRTFVTNAKSDKQLKTILQSSIQIAKELDLLVVAEGIEDAETLELVRELGCDRAQGYYIGRPMTSGQLSNWIIEYWQSNPPIAIE